ncbi:hypothetical protein BH24ACT15_BH24ACT15_05460 [soil metagenome]
MTARPLLLAGPDGAGVGVALRPRPDGHALAGVAPPRRGVGPGRVPGGVPRRPAAWRARAVRPLHAAVDAAGETRGTPFAPEMRLLGCCQGCFVAHQHLPGSQRQTTQHSEAPPTPNTVGVGSARRVLGSRMVPRRRLTVRIQHRTRWERGTRRASRRVSSSGPRPAEHTDGCQGLRGSRFRPSSARPPLLGGKASGRSMTRGEAQDFVSELSRPLGRTRRWLPHRPHSEAEGFEPSRRTDPNGISKLASAVRSGTEWDARLLADQQVRRGNRFPVSTWQEW